MNRQEARIDVVKLMEDLERNLQSPRPEMDLRASLRDVLAGSRPTDVNEEEHIDRILGLLRQHLSEERAHFYRVLQLFVQRLEKQEQTLQDDRRCLEQSRNLLAAAQSQLEEQRQAVESLRSLVVRLQEDGSSLARNTAQTLEGVVNRADVYGRNVEENNHRIRDLIERAAQLEGRLAAAAQTLEVAGDTTNRLESVVRRLDEQHVEVHGLMERVATLEERLAAAAQTLEVAGDTTNRLESVVRRLDEQHVELHGLMERVATLDSRLESHSANSSAESNPLLEQLREAYERLARTRGEVSSRLAQQEESQSQIRRAIEWVQNVVPVLERRMDDLVGAAKSAARRRAVRPARKKAAPRKRKG